MKNEETPVIKRAEPDMFQEVRAFYHSLIDGLEGCPYGAGWIKDIYPSPEFLRESIECGELYIAVSGNETVGAMVLNHKYNDSYRSFDWPEDVPDDKITVIHALGVHSAYTGRGYAKQMVRYAIDLSRETGQRVIRLDVLKGNVPAEMLYEGLGFKYLHTLPMFYEDTGWTDYELYEYSVL